jgi:hypothetical protein
VTHVGEEGGFGAAGLLGLVAGPLQLDDASLPLAAQEELALAQVDQTVEGEAD